MKRFFKEFKEFISRGNVLDMAVGIIIGGAFTAIVSSVVADLLTPLIGFLVPNGGFNKLNNIGPGFNFGNFINAVITFLLTAIGLFVIIKTINGLKNLSTKKKATEEEPAAPTTKICPFCRSEINIEATRCPHCTSELEK